MFSRGRRQSGFLEFFPLKQSSKSSRGSAGRLKMTAVPACLPLLTSSFGKTDGDGKEGEQTEVHLRNVSPLFTRELAVNFLLSHPKSFDCDLTETVEF